MSNAVVRSIVLTAALVMIASGAHASDKVQTETITIPAPDAQPTDKPLGIARDAEPLFVAPEPDAEGARPNVTIGLPEAAVDIMTDVSLLPSAVQRTRQRILDAARSGDPEALRPLIESFEEPPMVQFDGQTDAIRDLVAASGDPEGREILAILIEILQAGFVHLDPGTRNEVYVWPYFAHMALDNLSPEQMVELFTIVTAYDLEEMRNFGAYNFYRAGIAPDGQWVYFVAGD